MQEAIGTRGNYFKMAEEGSLPIDYKNLHELRVVDLKKELEKRGISKSGSKKDLVDRLKTVCGLYLLNTLACHTNNVRPMADSGLRL